MPDQEKILRTAFVVGAVTDALAIAPMIVPGFAKLLWGFEDRSGAYQFAMGYGASLMLGWTVLLAWAYQSPLERVVIRLKYGPLHRKFDRPFDVRHQPAGMDELPWIIGYRR